MKKEICNFNRVIKAPFSKQNVITFVHRSNFSNTRTHVYTHYIRLDNISGSSSAGRGLTNEILLANWWSQLDFYNWNHSVNGSRPWVDRTCTRSDFVSECVCACVRACANSYECECACVWQLRSKWWKRVLKKKKKKQ